ncbi:MAG: hypothetical protein QXI42_06210 [Thermoproteota archaeon]
MRKDNSDCVHIVIEVDKFEKLPKLCLEKMEFLKEDFPEMFEE